VEPAQSIVVATVAAAPLASPVVVAPDAAQARELVDAWAKAWSARDVERYLGFYASGFVSEKGLARAAWESGRRKRLASQRVISVAVRDVKVEAQTADRMTVRFVQDYSADTYRELATPKKLLLVREAGAWRIAAEGADSATGKAG
jgi:ketosteroid isomerase-like protein